jgi:hypothetical protein
MRPSLQNILVVVALCVVPSVSGEGLGVEYASDSYFVSYTATSGTFQLWELTREEETVEDWMRLITYREYEPTVAPASAFQEYLLAIRPFLMFDPTLYRNDDVEFGSSLVIISMLNDPSSPYVEHALARIEQTEGRSVRAVIFSIRLRKEHAEEDFAQVRDSGPLWLNELYALPLSPPTAAASESSNPEFQPPPSSESEEAGR